jgi:hypothetical protein
MSLSNNDWKESTGSLQFAGEVGRMAPILAPMDELEAAKLHQRVLLKYNQEICAQFSSNVQCAPSLVEMVPRQAETVVQIPPQKKKKIKREKETQINAGPDRRPLPQQYQIKIWRNMTP